MTTFKMFFLYDDMINVLSFQWSLICLAHMSANTIRSDSLDQISLTTWFLYNKFDDYSYTIRKVEGLKTVQTTSWRLNDVIL